jgi:hypothetical protein
MAMMVEIYISIEDGIYVPTLKTNVSIAERRKTTSLVLSSGLRFHEKPMVEAAN